MSVDLQYLLLEMSTSTNMQYDAMAFSWFKETNHMWQLDTNEWEW